MSIMQAAAQVVRKVAEVFLPGKVTITIWHGESNSLNNRIVVDGKPSKATNRIQWMGGKTGLVVRDPSGDFAPMATPDETLDNLRVFVNFWDDVEPVELNKGDVHDSNPSTYGPKHAKAGQVIPNTGGNRSVCYSKVVAIPERDSDGQETGMTHRYTAQVNVTRVVQKVDENGEVITGGKDKGFRVAARIIPRAENRGSSVESDFETLDTTD